MSIDERYRQAKADLEAVGQGHVLRFWDQLDPAGRASLLDDIAQVDLEQVARLVQTHVLDVPPLKLPENIEPPVSLPHEPTSPAQQAEFADARRQGEAMIRDGRVACLTVAGGQGTRLGYPGPKGEYPVSPIRNKPLFQLFAEQVRNAQNLYGVELYWLIMTSPLNDQPTRQFFARHDYFGLQPRQILFFVQGQMPAVATDGRILLAERDRLALSPDGHGGTLRAIHRSGALATVRQAGVNVLSYFQVDNPLIHPVDPLFIGLHCRHDAQISNKTIPKAGPTERVGNFCRADGRLMVIEYSDLPDELAHAADAGGGRLFDAASIAIHLFDTEFVAQLNAGGFHLPFHRAQKKVPYVDEAGRKVEPDAPNAIKLETFVFDALPLAGRTLLWQTRRDEEFAPVKNATGNDSLATSQAAQTARAARWLEAAGVPVPRKPDGSPDAVIEISPLLADSADQLAKAIRPEDVRVPPGGELYLGGPGESVG